MGKDEFIACILLLDFKLQGEDMYHWHFIWDNKPAYVVVYTDMHMYSVRSGIYHHSESCETHDSLFKKLVNEINLITNGVPL